MKNMKAFPDIVRQLRHKKLHSGHPFMINVKELRTDQCYLEFPDGIIQLVSIMEDKKDFSVIKQLSKEEASKLRTRLNFSKA